MGREAQGDTGLQTVVKKLELDNELKKGGEWLGAARSWMQHNIKDGDTLTWSSNKHVSVRFNQLEEFARKVAVAAILEDRNKRKK